MKTYLPEEDSQDQSSSGEASATNNAATTSAPSFTVPISQTPLLFTRGLSQSPRPQIYWPDMGGPELPRPVLFMPELSSANFSSTNLPSMNLPTTLSTSSYYGPEWSMPKYPESEFTRSTVCSSEIPKTVLFPEGFQSELAIKTPKLPPLELRLEHLRIQESSISEVQVPSLYFRSSELPDVVEDSTPRNYLINPILAKWFEPPLPPIVPISKMLVPELPASKPNVSSTAENKSLNKPVDDICKMITELPSQYGDGEVSSVWKPLTTTPGYEKYGVDSTTYSPSFNPIYSSSDLPTLEPSLKYSPPVCLETSPLLGFDQKPYTNYKPKATKNVFDNFSKFANSWPVDNKVYDDLCDEEADYEISSLNEGVFNIEDLRNFNSDSFASRTSAYTKWSTNSNKSLSSPEETISDYEDELRRLFCLSPVQVDASTQTTTPPPEWYGGLSFYKHLYDKEIALASNDFPLPNVDIDNTMEETEYTKFSEMVNSTYAEVTAQELKIFDDFQPTKIEIFSTPETGSYASTAMKLKIDVETQTTNDAKETAKQAVRNEIKQYTNVSDLHPIKFSTEPATGCLGAEASTSTATSATVYKEFESKGPLIVVRSPKPKVKSKKNQPKNTENSSICPYCQFCRNNGELAEFYNSHVLRDVQGRIVCPVLRSYVCPLCRSYGDNAHTVKYCPTFIDTPEQPTWAVEELKEKKEE